MVSGGGVPVVRYDLALHARVDSVISATQFTSTGVVGKGNGALVGYSVWVLRKADGTTTSPKGDLPRLVSAFVSSTGQVTHTAFGASLAVGDYVLLLHPSIASILTAIGPTGSNQGLSFFGVVSAVPGANQFTIPNLAGYGDTAFVGWNAFVLWDAAGLANPPQAEQQRITVYTSATGDFTTDAFSAAVGVGDIILLLNPRVSDRDGLVYHGTVTAVPGANQFTIPELAGLGAGKFFDLAGVAPYYAFVLRDGGGAGAAPQGESQAITNYATGTGNFTAGAFTVAVAAGDEILIIHPFLARIMNLAGLAPITGTAAQNWNAAEANIVQVGVDNTSYKLHSLLINISALIGTVTIRMYMEITGVERRVYQQAFTVALNGPGQWLINGSVAIHEVLRVTAQSDNAADDGQSIDYDYMLEEM